MNGAPSNPNDVGALMNEVLPGFSRELFDALMTDGDASLTSQVQGLRVVKLCRCNDAFCSSFYAGPRPNGSWSDEGEHSNVMPTMTYGMVVLDVVNGRIRYVEILDRLTSARFWFRVKTCDRTQTEC
jgi:hypothetical protein